MIPASVLCVGETLWDVLPTGEFLGGAPLNVAAHLVRLGTPNGTAEEVAYVLQHGAAVNVVNRDGWSPLVFAARTGARAMVERLLRAGADRSTVAAAGDRFETARLIRQAGLGDLLA